MCRVHAMKANAIPLPRVTIVCVLRVCLKRPAHHLSMRVVCGSSCTSGWHAAGPLRQKLTASMYYGYERNATRHVTQVIHRIAM